MMSAAGVMDELLNAAVKVQVTAALLLQSAVKHDYC